MKKHLGYLFLFQFFFCFSLFSTPLKVSVAADAALLMNADTGAVLYEKNAKTLYYPASITKIATALYALHKKGDHLDDIVIVEQDCVTAITPDQKRRSQYKKPAHWLETDGMHIGIKAGEEIIFKDLLYAMMVASANDAANSIAQYVSGDVPTFIEELNAYLKTIGCKDTRFLNPHGLHHPEHKTTAYDMAIMTKEALKNPVFREIVSTVRYTRPETNKQESSTLVQTNKLLRNGQYHYSKAIGVKTGHHSHALQTFVGAAEHDGRTLIAVLMRGKERNDIFKDTANLFETAFKQSKMRKTLLQAGPQAYTLKLERAEKPIKTYLKENVMLEYYPAEEPQIKAMIFWDKVSLPIAKDQRVGELRILAVDGQVVLKSAAVYSVEEVKGSWLNIFYRFFSFFGHFSTLFKWMFAICAVCILSGLSLLFRRT